MRRPIHLTAAVLAAVFLSGCVEESGTRDSSAMRGASNAAESACMSAVNANYGGNVRDLRVTRSEFSQANSVVMITASGVRGGNQTERWRCLVSDTGNVAELTVVQ